jgi:hypothetical protein
MKTGEALEQLGVTHHRLIGLFRSNKIARPGRDRAGDYDWQPDDIEAARRALAIDLRYGPRPRRRAVPA